MMKRMMILFIKTGDSGEKARLDIKIVITLIVTIRQQSWKTM